jgi:hypothetical protein
MVSLKCGVGATPVEGVIVIDLKIHEVAPFQTLDVETVEADAVSGTGEEAEDGGEPGEEFHVHRHVYTFPPQQEEGAHGIGEDGEIRIHADGMDALFGNHVGQGQHLLVARKGEKVDDRSRVFLLQCPDSRHCEDDAAHPEKLDE